MSFLMKLIGLSVLIDTSLQLSTPESLTYVAGVVEYLVNDNNPEITSTEQFHQNANKYIDIMRSRDAVNVDIIVFPESTLNSRSTAVIVPSEIENVDLCTDMSYDENLRNMACTVRDLKKYVVINLTMKRNCTLEREMADDPDHEEESSADCPSEWILYNANVVFDRDGKVISIYRKFNLFGETGITKPSSADISTFTTDFDVTFGHFICFDLMFQSPALDLIDQGIKNIVFPTMWFSELPFLTAVQAQQNWAHANDVNFLAAGANWPRVGSTGTGIYSGKSGALISTMTGEERTRLLVHEVAKIPGTTIATSSQAYSGNNFDNLFLKRDQLDAYTRKEIELPESTSTPLNYSFTLCHTFQEELCCEFRIDVALRSVAENSTTTYKYVVQQNDYELTFQISYTYFAVVFHGVRTFDGFANGGIQACAVLACRNNDISTCGTMHPSSNEVVDSNINFQKIVINGNFTTENVLVMPSSLNFHVSPYPTSDFSFNESTNPGLAQNNIETKNVVMSLLTPKADLFTFAIYARDFELDNSGIGKPKLSSMVLMVLHAASLKHLLAH